MGVRPSSFILLGNWSLIRSFGAEFFFEAASTKEAAKLATQ
jgi:hypothetical protein